MRTPFICGNWKMFKKREEARDFALKFRELYQNKSIKTAIFAPFTDLETLVEMFKGTGIMVGAQNVHYEKEGAFTGEVSIGMLEDLAVDYCIIGHSERREYFGETDETVNLKLKALLNSKILPLVCVGESLETRESGKEKEFVKNQVELAFKEISKEDAVKVTIAYEPIWAIGTGKTATKEEANDMCTLIRSTLAELYDKETSDKMIIQYGGSVKPENASDIMNMPEIDGALVGGASLEPLKFIEIVNF